MPADNNQLDTDEPDDENLYVVDPDDYQRTRKLKAINDAKAHVHKLRREKPPRATDSEWSGIHARISEAVALYGAELIPLIEDAQDRGLLDDDDLETKYAPIKTFVEYSGRLPKTTENDGNLNFEDPKPFHYMAFYRQLERIQRKLGLGLELAPDNSEASGDYSDVADVDQLETDA